MARRWMILAVAGLVMASVAGAAGAPGALAASGPPAGPQTAGRVPPVPFLESVTASGLGLVAAWAPDPVPASVTGYAVAASPAAGAPKSCKAETAHAPRADSQAKVAGLCAGVVYRVRVRAASAAGSSAWSGYSAPAVPLARRQCRHGRLA